MLREAAAEACSDCRVEVKVCDTVDIGQACCDAPVSAQRAETARIELNDEGVFWYLRTCSENGGGRAAAVAGKGL